MDRDCPAAAERGKRHDPEFDRPGSSLNGHVASLLSFQFNVPVKARNFSRASAIAICRTLNWTDEWAGSIDHIETAVASLGVSTCSLPSSAGVCDSKPRSAKFHRFSASHFSRKRPFYGHFKRAIPKTICSTRGNQLILFDF
jgi:hypothetical protein